MPKNIIPMPATLLALSFSLSTSTDSIVMNMKVLANVGYTDTWPGTYRSQAIAIDKHGAVRSRHGFELEPRGPRHGGSHREVAGLGLPAAALDQALDVHRCSLWAVISIPRGAATRISAPLMTLSPGLEPGLIALGRLQACGLRRHRLLSAV